MIKLYSLFFLLDRKGAQLMDGLCEPQFRLQKDPCHAIATSLFLGVSSHYLPLVGFSPYHSGYYGRSEILLEPLCSDLEALLITLECLKLISLSVSINCVQFWWQR